MLDRAPHPLKGHNGGPPLDDLPEWGRRPFGNYFEWRGAHRRAWKRVPMEIARRRAKLAEAAGLTYREFQLEILERGRYLTAGADAQRIDAIKARRKPS